MNKSGDDWTFLSILYDCLIEDKGILEESDKITFEVPSDTINIFKELSLSHKNVFAFVYNIMGNLLGVDIKLYIASILYYCDLQDIIFIKKDEDKTIVEFNQLYKKQKAIEQYKYFTNLDDANDYIEEVIGKVK